MSINYTVAAYVHNSSRRCSTVLHTLLLHTPNTFQKFADSEILSLRQSVGFDHGG